jgi:hypothetical protein
MVNATLGHLPPRYLFAVNAYEHERFSRCPQCRKVMYPRKFALLIHIKGADFVILRKTCRYCVRCELIIAHQNELEGELALALSTRSPKLTGHPYLVLGTVDLKFWREGLSRAFDLEALEMHTSDFREYRTLSVEGGGWKPKKRKSRRRH